MALVGAASLARAGARKNNAELNARARCGAKCRTSGDPCRNPAVKGGTRCRLHGGRTPKGAGWHKPTWPDPSTPDGVGRLNRKLADRNKAARKRARRLEAMTPEERAAHDAWQKAHAPGDPKRRAADRERRRQNRDAAALLADLEARDDDVDPFTQGVFG